ncbi:hypothetical protein C8J57DRAFT_1509708 [Mycena rebaudengoi]|nr:hypothetical protein C8J57DRAFT_1509708 [Mycena rebaudengoi]
MSDSILLTFDIPSLHHVKKPFWQPRTRVIYLRRFEILRLWSPPPPSALIHTFPSLLWDVRGNTSGSYTFNSRQRQLQTTDTRMMTFPFDIFTDGSSAAARPVRLNDATRAFTTSYSDGSAFLSGTLRLLRAAKSASTSKDVNTSLEHPVRFFSFHVSSPPNVVVQRCTPFPSSNHIASWIKVMLYHKLVQDRRVPPIAKELYGPDAALRLKYGPDARGWNRTSTGAAYLPTPRASKIIIDHKVLPSDYGDFTLLSPENEQVFAYTRSYKN